MPTYCRGAMHGALLIFLWNSGPAHASADVAGPPAQAPAATAPVFGPLDVFVGRSFVNQLYTLEVYREGDALALHFGHAGGARWGRFLVRPDAAPGTYMLAETTFPSSPKNRLAYFEAGSLNLEFTIDDYRHRIRVGALDGSLQVDAFGAEKRFGRFGAFQQINSNLFRPVNAKALQVAALNNQAEFERRRQEEQAKREREQERAQEMAAVYEGLKRANTDAAAREAESRAAMNATLQSAQIQAQREEQVRGHGEGERAVTARETTAPSVASSQSTAPSVASSSSTAPTGGRAATAGSLATAATATREQRCEMIHPKVNDTFLTSRGEAFARKHLGDKAAESCRYRTGNTVFTGDITCKAESQYVTSCAILAECAGQMRAPSCSGMAQ